MMHNATSGQIATTPWGVRPAHPLDVSAQQLLVAATCVAAGIPLLGVPSLVDAPAEAIDGRTLRNLLKVNLARKKNEEEEKKKQEKAAESRRRAQALVDRAASLPNRKKKKKRKKKLPRSGYKFLPRSRRLFGTNSTLFLREGGPWLLRSILAASCPHGSLQAKMPDILVGMDQKDTCAAAQSLLPLLALYAFGNLDFLRVTGIWQLLVRCSSCLPTRNYFYGPLYLAVTCAVYSTTPLYLTVTCSGLALEYEFFGFFWKMTCGISVFSTPWFDSGYMLGVSFRGLLASTLQKTAKSPQLQFFDGRRHSLRSAEADCHRPAVDHRGCAVAVRAGWSMSLLCKSCRFQFCGCTFSMWSSTPLSLRRVHPMVQTVRLTWDSPVPSNGGRRPFLQVEQVHFPVVAQRQVP